MKKKALLTLLAALMIAGTAFAVTNESTVTVAPEDETAATVTIQEETVPEKVQDQDSETTEASLVVKQNEDGSLEVVKVETSEK